MLIIRKEQITSFEQLATNRFEDEMVAHSQMFSPKLCDVIGPDQVRIAVRQAIERAGQYGFTYRGPIRLFIELIFLFGSAFDTDPQYPFLGKLLAESGDQMQRAEQLHQEVVAYLQEVSGEEDIHVRRAFETLAYFARSPMTFSTNDLVPAMLAEMTHTFPQKAAYLGEEALTALIQQGRDEAYHYAFDTVRGQVLVIVLMYAFGHGCTDDPLYPWISRTLRDEKIVDPQGRAERLERKAVTWLEHVIAGWSEGERK